MAIENLQKQLLHKAQQNKIDFESAGESQLAHFDAQTTLVHLGLVVAFVRNLGPQSTARRGVSSSTQDAKKGHTPGTVGPADHRPNLHCLPLLKFPQFAADARRRRLSRIWSVKWPWST
jgi:hypothetical protein